MSLVPNQSVMDSQHEAIVTRSLTQLHTDLGVLLGAGRISTAIHEQILALINNSNDTSHICDAGKAASIFFRSSGLDMDPVHLKEPSRGLITSILPASPLRSRETAWKNQQSLASIYKEAMPEPRPSIVVCPWFCTRGYTCGIKDCPWAHKDVTDGIKEPLICVFWADNERCTKSVEHCRFAHYWAVHRQIAPRPSTKYNPGNGN